MREFTLPLSEALRNGLRPDYRTGANEPFLFDCNNAKPSKNGLVSPSIVTLPVDISDQVFPYPQLFRGKYQTLLVYETALYTVDEGDWSISAVTLYDSDAIDDVATIDPGGVWQFIDFHNSWILLNGSCIIYKALWSEKVLVKKNMTIKAGCEFRGRSILGCFNPDDLMSADISGLSYNSVLWSTIGGGAGDLYWLLDPEGIHATGAWGIDISAKGQVYINSLPSEGDTITIGSDVYTFRADPTLDTDVAIETTTLLQAFELATVVEAHSSIVTARAFTGGILEDWGTIPMVEFTVLNAGDSGNSTTFTVSNFFATPNQPFVGGEDNRSVYSEDTPLHMEGFEQNEWGWMPLPFQGEILAIRPLRKGVVVYGENGIVALTHNIIERELSTFGMEVLSNIGITNRGAVGGNEEVHTFLGMDGKLRQIDGDFNVKELGYKEFFHSMVNPDGIAIKEDVVVALDEEEKEFYVSNNKECFILTPTGLGKGSQLVTSLAHVEGQLIGIFVQSGDRKFSFTVQLQDSGYSGHKSVESLEVSGDWNIRPEVCVYFKYKVTEPWRQSRWIRLNDNNSAFIHISANYYMPAFRVSPYSYTYIKDVRLKWKREDARDVRGVQTVPMRTIEREYE